MSPSALFRLVAVLLLLLTAGELLACEKLDTLGCPAFGAAPSTSESPDDSCICCCKHIMVVQRTVMLVTFGVVTEVPPLQVAKPETSAFRIYHPPKA